MKICIDKNFHCHTANPDNAFREFEVPFFDGKCKTFVEGFIHIPNGEVWVRSDGMAFEGSINTPWKDYDELDDAQRQYEQALIADMQQALKTLGVNVDG